MPFDSLVLEAISLLLFWSMVECGAAITAACLPTMKVLFCKSSLEKVVRILERKLPSRFRDIESQLRAGSSVEHRTTTEAGRSRESGIMGVHRPLSLAGPRGGGARVQDTFNAQNVDAWTTILQSKYTSYRNAAALTACCMLHTTQESSQSAACKGVHKCDLWHGRNSTLVQTLPCHKRRCCSVAKPSRSLVSFSKYWRIAPPPNRH